MLFKGWRRIRSWLPRCSAFSLWSTATSAWKTCFSLTLVGLKNLLISTITNFCWIISYCFIFSQFSVNILPWSVRWKSYETGIPNSVHIRLPALSPLPRLLSLSTRQPRRDDSQSIKGQLITFNRCLQKRNATKTIIKEIMTTQSSILFLPCEKGEVGRREQTWRGNVISTLSLSVWASPG